MKFEFKFDVYLHAPSDPALALLIHQGKSIMAALQKLIDEVAENKAVTQSAITLIKGLKAKLDDAIASGDPAKLQELADSLDTSGNELATAITANTPAEPGNPGETPADPQ